MIIQRHILGFELFTSPLQYIAADVNNDQKVTAADLVEMRKAILRISDYFKSNTSWILLDETSLKTETNPWAIKKYFKVQEGRQDINDLKFVALKVGDVEGEGKSENKF